MVIAARIKQRPATKGITNEIRSHFCHIGQSHIGQSHIHGSPWQAKASGVQIGQYQLSLLQSRQDCRVEPFHPMPKGRSVDTPYKIQSCLGPGGPYSGLLRGKDIRYPGQPGSPGPDRTRISQVGRPLAGTQPIEKFFSKPDFWGPNGFFPPGNPWTEVVAKPLN